MKWFNSLRAATKFGCRISKDKRLRNEKEEVE
jgi:hypothetical protein